MTQTLSTVASDGTFTNISLAPGFSRRCFDKIAARDTSDAEYAMMTARDDCMNGFRLSEKKWIASFVLAILLLTH